MHTGASALDLSQSGFAVRVGWGMDGLALLAPSAEVAVIVDVLSFSTAVAVAHEAGAEVVPWDPDEPLPDSDGLLVAGARSHTEPSLSPASLRSLPPGTRLLLRSLNGSRLMAWARSQGVRAVTGCLRDREAVAASLAHAESVAIIAAGERWPGSDRVRFALEDWIGAGSVVAALAAQGSPSGGSPEAVAAKAAYDVHAPDLLAALRATGSGRELIAQGFEQDVAVAAGLM